MTRNQNCGHKSISLDPDFLSSITDAIRTRVHGRRESPSVDSGQAWPTATTVVVSTLDDAQLRELVASLAGRPLTRIDADLLAIAKTKEAQP